MKVNDMRFLLPVSLSVCAHDIKCGASGGRKIHWVLLSFLILFASSTYAQTPTRDNNMAMGNPTWATSTLTDSNNYLLVRSQYALSYNNSKGIANWVSWHLSAAWKGSAARCNCFTQDTSLPIGYFRASTGNYTGTGFDRGHLCPSDDRDGSDSDNKATFKMSNIVPQAPYLNEQTWAYLEDYCRSLLNQNKELYIIAGGYGSGGNGSGGGTTYNIASGAINVPAYFWKVILVLPADTNDIARVTTATRVIAVLMPNTQTANAYSWDHYRVSVDSIEALTGYDLFSNVDTAIQRIIEAGIDNGATSLMAWDLTGANNLATWGATTVNTNLDTAAGRGNMTRGSGAGASAGANSYRTTGFQNNGIATSNTDHFMVKVKANTGYTLSLSSLDAAFAGTASFCATPGVSAQYAYSLDGSAFTLISTPFTTIGTPSTMSTIDISGISALQNVQATQTVYLRYFASGQTTTGGWGFYSSDTGKNGLSIGGSVDPIGTILGNFAVCATATTTLSDTTSGGIWSSSNTLIAAIGSLSGIATGISAGTATMSYAISGRTFTSVLTVNSVPAAGTITGALGVCAGSSTTFSDATSGGSWSSSNTGIATVGSTGVVSGIAAGTVTISYTITNGCGSAYATKPITVDPLPAAPASISGAVSLCAGSSTTFSDATSGGSWSSSNTGIATVGSTGVVSGIASGTATISYTISNGCGTAYAKKPITVNPLPATPSSISGAASVCAGISTTFSDATAGGVWSSSNTGIVTAGSTGVITGVAAGTAVISYILSNSCGGAYVTKPIPVNPLPVAGTITGISSVCVGATITLVDASPGGGWSATNTRAMVSSGGLVYGITAGADTIVYTVANSCGTSAALKPITISPLPNAGGISGSSAVCASSSIVLTESITGGTWSATNVSATVAGGTVSGIIAGQDTIVYIVTNTCGTATATKTVTINPLPVAGILTGATSVCDAASVILTASIPGGVWSASNSTAIVSSGGIVYGITAGRDTIVYTVINGCGTVYTSKTVTVNPLPFAGCISGLPSVCVGAGITLTDAAPSGSWSAANGNVTVSGGVVTGLTAGADTIIYTVTNVCGIATAAKNVTVNALPDAGTITGSPVVCVSDTTALTNSQPGGSWSEVTGNSFVSASGVVYGVYAGHDTISYTVTNMCGTAVASKIITINPLPDAGVITGPSSVCPGDIMALSDTAQSGTWLSSNTTVASIDVTGIVTGRFSGNTTISYMVMNKCGDATAVYIVTVPGDCDNSVNSIPEAEGIKIYPNPAGAILHIAAPVKVNIAIAGIDGRTVAIKNDARTIDISGLENAMYFAKIYNEQNVLIKTIRFVKID